MIVNWKQIFRRHLIDTKNMANFTTVFDINKYKYLLKVTENVNRFGPDEYIKCWELQGDEKYTGLDIPKEELVYTFPKTLFIVTRYYAINDSSLEWKDCQLWKFIVINDGDYFESPIISSLEEGNIVKFYNIPSYLELGINDSVLKINKNRIEWMGKSFDLSLDTKYQRQTNMSNFELLNLYSVSQTLKNGLVQHFIWKYDRNIIENIKYIIMVIINNNLYNKFLNIISYENNEFNVSHIRQKNPMIPDYKNIKEYTRSQVNCKIQWNYTDNNNWNWVILNDPKSINIDNLYAPFDYPPKELFTIQSIDAIPFIIIFTLYLILVILIIIFIIYPFAF